MTVYTGTPGTDTFIGGTTADEFDFAPADLSSADTVNGGGGSAVDTLVFTAAGTVAADAFAHVTHIEQITLADGTNDITLAGNLLPDTNGEYGPSITVNGGSGNDTVDASQFSANVVFNPGSGDDTLIGGGYATYYFAPGDLTSGDTISGSYGYSTIVFTAPGTVDASAFTHVSGVDIILLDAPGITVTTGVAGGGTLNRLAIDGSTGNDTVDASGIPLDSNNKAPTVTFDTRSGDDTLIGAAVGTNIFNFAVSDLTSGDSVTGGTDPARYDILQITTSGTLAADALAHVTHIEEILLYGPGHNITLSNALVASSDINHTLIIKCNPSNNDGNFNDTVDASGVTTAAGRLLVYSGPGNETFTGGLEADTFFFSGGSGSGFVSFGDTVNGGTGSSLDQITDTSGVTLTKTNLANVSHIEIINATGGVYVPDALVSSADDSHVLTVYAQFVDASAVTTSTNTVVFRSATVAAENWTGGAGADQFYLAANDLTSADTVNGGSGVDTLHLTTAGTVAANAFANVTHVEQMTLANGTNSVALTDALIGSSDLSLFAVVGGTGNDTIDASAVTTATHRVYFVSGSGNDTLTGGAGADIFNFAAADLTSADTVNGGGGTMPDSLVFTTAGTIAASAFAGVSHIETITLAAGSNNVTLTDALASSADDGHVLAVNGGSGSDTIDASAVTTAANLVVFKSGAGNDVLTGGAGTDQFFFAPADLTSGDTVNGGSGTDTLRFTAAGVVGASTFANVTHVEQITLANGTNSVALADAMVGAADNHLVVVAGGSGADTIDASAVTTAANRVYFVGGGGADVLTAGAGADIFSYGSAADSTSTGFDTINAINFAADRLDVPGAAGTITLVEGARGGVLDSGANFDTELGSAFTALGAHHAGLFTASGGSLNGQMFLVVDVNGTTGYQAGADLVIHLAGATGTLTTADFI